MSKIERDYAGILAVTSPTIFTGTFLVRLPALLPDILASSKVAFTLAVLGAVVAEFVQPDKGLGYVILVAQSSFNLDSMYLAIAMLVTQGLTVFGIISLIERRQRRHRGEHS